MNYEQLSKQIHADNVAKGFWEKRRSTSTLLMLVISELAEATEAVRDKLPPVCFISTDKIYFEVQPQVHMFTDSSGKFMKPEGEAIEIADAVIRVLDMLGSMNYPIEEVMKTRGLAPELPEMHTPIDAHFCLAMTLSIQAPTGLVLCAFIITAEKIFQANDWDLEAIINLKLAYNKTRDHRHGGKAY